MKFKYLCEIIEFKKMDYGKKEKSINTKTENFLLSDIQRKFPFI